MQYPVRNIDNVVFDLGGVIIDLRRENAVSALENLGIADAGELLGLYRQEGPFLALETGRISAAEFFDLLGARACPGTSALDIEKAFNSFLVDLPTRRLDMLLSLRKAGKRIFALSNTNAVMYNSWIMKAFSRQGLRINDYFDGIVASFQEGVCKPDPGIFGIVLHRYSLDPDRTLMLDDSEANCASAMVAGMKAFVVDNSRPESSVETLAARLISGDE